MASTVAGHVTRRRRFSPADAPYLRRLNAVLRKQEQRLARVQQQAWNDGTRKAIRSFVEDLGTLQTAIWNSLAKRPRSPLLRIAQRVDMLAEQWSVVANELAAERQV
ncbi:MAG: hypothetical protein JO247_01040 [Chloroflexi bacterium]|nr:hypothetical protein [Chloroflexota bacterium]